MIRERRVKKWLFAVMAATGILLAGCGGNAEETGAVTDDAQVSREMLAGLVGESFGYKTPAAEEDFFTDVASDNPYYQEIQACTEWGVFEDTDEFDPEEAASLGFVLETAVKAIGMEDINYCDPAAALTEDNLVDFYVSNIAQIDASDPDKKVDVATAQEILAYAVDYRNDMVFPQVCEVALEDGVIEATEEIIFLGDGSTAMVNGENPYQVGDTVYIPPTDASTANAIRISGVNGNEITYSQAPLDEVFSEMHVSGTYDAKVLAVATASDAVSVMANTGYNVPPMLECRRETYNAPAYLEDENGNYYLMNAGDTSCDVDHTDNSITFKVSVSEKYENEEGVEANATGEVVVDISNIKVTTDVDLKTVLIGKKQVARVTFDDKIEVNLDGHVGIIVPVASVPLQLGTTPMDVEMSASLYIGVDGTASITYTSDVVASVSYKLGNGLSKDIDNNNSDLDLHAQVTVTIEPTILIDLRLARQSVVNVQATTGIVAEITADVDVLGDDPDCVDLYAYVPLRWGINQENCALRSLVSDDLKYEETIWDSESSEVTLRRHIEDGAEVEACTRGSGEEVVTPVVDENGEPYDELKFFDFEPIEFGVIELSSYAVYVDPSSTAAISILSLPVGYSNSDLQYSVADSSICSIDGSGNVTGLKPGCTNVLVTTSDGQYSVMLMVVVKDEYEIEGGFESL